MTPIRCGDYAQFCDSVFDHDDAGIPPQGVVYVPLDRINQFFNLINKHNPVAKYVVVSARSDFGLAYQEENPLWADMIKWLPFMQNEQSMRELSYNPLVLPPRGKMENCKITDRYSVKCYCFTESTFDFIPENVVKWFCVNANIRDNRIEKLPFGIQEQADISLFRKKQEVANALYINFANNTNERLRLSNFFLNSTIPAKIVRKPKAYEEYLEDIASFRYVLCPPGNGYDSYRIWETLYSGNVPVIFSDYWNETFRRLPLISIDEKELYDPNLINKLNDLDSRMNENGTEMLDLEFWKTRIRDSVLQF